MKKIIISLLAVATLASCSKNEAEAPVTPALPDLSAPIILSAGVDATTQTRALSGTSFPASTNDVFSVVGYTGSAAPTNWASPYFNNAKVNSGAASALSFVNDQYYPANGDKVYFYAYAPSVASLTAVAGSVTAAYTLTGQQDILWAKADGGIAKVAAGVTQPQPELQFAHKLMQLKFKVIADASFETGKTVTKITAKAVNTAGTLNIGTGVLTSSTSGDLSISPTTSNSIVTGGGTALVDYLLLNPTGAGSTVTLEIVAGGVTYSNISVTLTGTGNGVAGASHTITLTFKRNGVTPTAAISAWTSTGAGASDVI